MQSTQTNQLTKVDNTPFIHASQSNEHELKMVELSTIFEQQKTSFEATPYPEYHARLANLKTLYKLINDNAETLAEALNKDFGCRSRQETEIAEIIGSLSSIRYLQKNLKRFMKPERRRTSIWFLPASGKVISRPLGVVGVMAPWNYSLHLTIAPVAAALAAGNRVMAKMSELTPETARTLRRLVAQYFSTDTLAVIDGDLVVAQAFSAMPFNHLLFTGSTNVGKKIASAAAKNLTPVTLELSGKSPVVIGKDYNIEEAACRIMWGKSFNAGQTCVAPDYVLVPRHKLLEFTRAARAAVKRYYPNGVDDHDYTSIINAHHCQRIKALLTDANEKGVEVLPLTEFGKDDVQNINKIPPTLVLEPNKDCKIFDEEVFGPVLPVFTYENLSEAEALVKQHPDPLALYIFSHQPDEIAQLSQSIPAGSIGVNETLLQYIQNDLPFGGVGQSGLGKYHGNEGFKAFSNQQAIFKQSGLGSYTGTKLLYPPYGKLTHLMLKLIRTWP